MDIKLRGLSSIPERMAMAGNGDIFSFNTGPLGNVPVSPYLSPSHCSSSRVIQVLVSEDDGQTRLSQGHSLEGQTGHGTRWPSKCNPVG